VKSLLVLIVGLFAASANAHFKIGFYDGMDEAGQACSFEIKSVNFKTGKKHPLNEQVQIAMNFVRQSELEFTHLAIVDAVTVSVRPKKEVLSAVSATSSGAEAFELIMNHEGPQQMIYLLDDYSNESLKRSAACQNLKYRE
jgi:hypothetical protein